MAFRKAAQTLAAGMRAPVFELRDPDGVSHSLHSLLERGPVLLAFFKVTCPVCQYTFPFLERLHQGGAGGIQVVGISQDGAAATRDFCEEFGVTFPILLDESGAGYAASNAFGIQSVPSLFLVEPDGQIALSGSGFSKRELEALGRRAGVVTFRPDERVPEQRPG